MLSRALGRAAGGGRQARRLHGVRVGVVREPGEARVALVPDNVKTLVAKGARVVVSKGAGERAGYSDDMYTQAGATLDSEAAVWKSDIVVAISNPGEGEWGACGWGAGARSANGSPTRSANVGRIAQRVARRVARRIAQRVARRVARRIARRVTQRQPAPA
jgi:NAD/NADP transhydrogenase alpha subunit